MVFNTLVIDDSSVMRKMVIRTLKMSGMPVGEIHEAADGQEALEVMGDHWIDLALVDINMPVMNGEEFIHHVRAEESMRDLAIIVVSTESSETRIRALMDQGAEFVHKPFTPEMLREKIIKVTGVSDDGPQLQVVGSSDLDF
jgi:two-component system, chemotaxis family, chemotaxis protein CheY